MQSVESCIEKGEGGSLGRIECHEASVRLLREWAAVTSSCFRQLKSQHIADLGEAAIIMELWNISVRNQYTFSFIYVVCQCSVFNFVVC